MLNTSQSPTASGPLPRPTRQRAPSPEELIGPFGQDAIITLDGPGECPRCSATLEHCADLAPGLVEAHTCDSCGVVLAA